ncbi:MAG: bifunctional riboflavin kinase/FAD synthetase [Gemella sp.]|nr:bifunctional riboflavin kinase/FAD synthetase [Gemella sp.]
MNVFDIEDINEIQADDINRVVALGFFDGLHRGHKEIISRAVAYAKKQGLKSCLITFDISPKEFFSKEKVKLLTPRKQKLSILKDLGIDEVYVIKFNDKLSKFSREEFIDNVLLKLNIKSAFCGEDYLFGHMGKGTPTFIEEYTKNIIEVNVVNLIKAEDDFKVSSSTLRNLIYDGKVSEYKEKSGNYYKISGHVIKGKQLGRTISFPTANLELEEEYVVPKQLGVYITKLKIGENYYKGITNIGKNPTVSDTEHVNIETHILNFDKDIYGERIELTFYEYIRSEKKFSGLTELKEQLKNDKEIAEMYDINLSIEIN